MLLGFLPKGFAHDFNGQNLTEMTKIINVVEYCEFRYLFAMKNSSGN